jgi:intraflagellar transport protein 88
MELIEESCLASSRGEQRLALDKAKEASSKERSLIRMQEQAGLSETHNLDLTFSVIQDFTSSVTELHKPLQSFCSNGI